MRLSKPLAGVPSFLAMLNGAHGCETDEDCSLNGVCNSETAACECDPGWKADDCGQLDLHPANKWAGYNRTNYSSPDYDGDKGNSSWGGQIIQDRDNPTTFHLVTSQFAHGCGLGSWKPQSQVIRAQSDNGPQGPYHYKQTLFGQFRHNPYWFWSEADQKYLLYTIGVNMEAPDECGSQTIGPNNISVSSAENIDGPWTDFQQLLTDYTNPAPWPLYTEDNETRAIVLAVEDNYIFEAAQFDAEQVLIKTQPWELDGSKYQSEDPFLWRDKRGNWHLLVHWMVDVVESNGDERGPRVGAHLFSRSLDGDWTFKLQTAFNTTVDFTDGDTIEYYRRERPKIYFSNDGEMTPLYLLTGVEEADSGGASYTVIAPIGSSASEYEKDLGIEY